MARPRRKTLTAEELICIQLYIAADGQKPNHVLWAEAHRKNMDPSDRPAVSKFLARPETKAVLEKLGTPPPHELARKLKAIKKEQRPPKPPKPVVHEPSRQELRVKALANSFVERTEMIGFWEQVLVTGAHEVLRDLQSDDPKLAHLVEYYKVTKDGVEIRMPSKKDAAAILTTLKGLDRETSLQDQRRQDAEEAFANSEYFLAWRERMAERLMRRGEAGETIDAKFLESADNPDTLTEEVSEPATGEDNPPHGTESVF